MTSVSIDPTLAILTRADSSFGYEFLNRLQLKGTKPAILCIENTPFSKRIKMARFLTRKIGIFDSIRYNTKFWMPIIQRKISFGHWHPLPVFDGLAEKIVITDNINSLFITHELANNRIKKIILAQSGIIRNSILNLGKPIINCHPGKLPNLRGVDVIRWALLEREPIEVTLHLVDTGIDTGAILKKIPITIYSNDSITSIIDKTISQSIDLLVEAALTKISDYGLPIPQDVTKGKQYYLMPFKLVNKLEADWTIIREIYTRS